MIMNMVQFVQVMGTALIVEIMQVDVIQIRIWLWELHL
jgi:hypothetical protein